MLLLDEPLEELDEGECLLLLSRTSAGLRLGGDADLSPDCFLDLHAIRFQACMFSIHSALCAVICNDLVIEGRTAHAADSCHSEVIAERTCLKQRKTHIS